MRQTCLLVLTTLRSNFGSYILNSSSSLLILLSGGQLADGETGGGFKVGV